MATSVNIEPHYIEIIERWGRGTSFNAKLRDLLDQFSHMKSELVRFSPEGELLWLRDDARMAFLKFNGVEYGDGFEELATLHTDQMKMKLEAEGFIWQEIDMQDVGLYGIYVAPADPLDHTCAYKKQIDKIREVLNVNK